MNQRKRDTLVLQVGSRAWGDDPIPEQNLLSGNLRGDALDGFNKQATWLQGKGIDFWYMERSNIIQDWSTATSALSVKIIQTRHNGITGNKMAGQRYNGHEITYTILQ